MGDSLRSNLFFVLVSRVFAQDPTTEPVPVPAKAPPTQPEMPTPVQQVDTALNNTVTQVDQLNTELAQIISLLRDRRGLPTVAPFVAVSEVVAEQKLELAFGLKSASRVEAAPLP